MPRIELGMGGLQPQPARDVFAHRYGDCKDKATLLAAMLKVTQGSRMKQNERR